MQGTSSCSLHSSESTLKSEDIDTLDTSSVTEDVTVREGASSEELRRQKRLVRNRISAERSRRRRLSRIEELRADIDRLRKELEYLQAMEVENRYLKRQVQLRESLFQLKCAVQPQYHMFTSVNDSVVEIASWSQQKWERDLTSKEIVCDVEKLCYTKSQGGPCSDSWSVGYEAPWLKQAWAAREALARQLSNHKTHEIS
ncbi:hypothetical protein GpartN1_g3717.t1 [Galdieria partita]|uniref:BZIP domain-containing protein n=1 Tax=Galdieria partita TaxID=83374 RepID=A0A9C7PS68_9RHOD|nr:hypothetical protein GpartN1_g1285.t1 [Galdieria partita]GJQ11926.1 hypothetical protein GpartN1_g3717.t1 [Galdieria partita]